jgi:hypothetical protein
MNPAYQKWQSSIRNLDLRFFSSLWTLPPKNVRHAPPLSMIVTKPFTPAKTNKTIEAPGRLRYTNEPFSHFLFHTKITIHHFPVSKVNGTEREGCILRIMGDHHNRLSFFIKRLKEFHNLSSCF